jgi:uridine kinase
MFKFFFWRKNKKEIPEYNIEEWREEMIKKINEVLLQKEKAFVCIAGASASGKGEATEYLLQKLNKEGKKTIVISTDDFYKGISKMLAENLSEYFSSFNINWQEIEEEIKKVTKEKEFDEKFTAENLQLILKKIEEKSSIFDYEEVFSIIKEKIKELNFDSPNAINLDLILEAINRIKENKEVEIPAYSMQFSEPTEERKINGADYNVILLEGIFALNEKLAEKADIKTFIKSDRRTLFMRRFRRDVLLDRTSFSPETTLCLVLETVLPSYDKYVLPDCEKSDFVLVNNYTENEVFDTNFYEVQDKVFLEKLDIEKIEEKLGKINNAKIQKDFYFTNKGEEFNPEHLLRIREEDGELESLIYKGTKIRRNDGKIIRPTETYIRKEDFGLKYKGVGEILKALDKAGFKLVGKIYKERKIYKKDNIEIALDKVEELGNYIEIKTNNKLSKSLEIDKIKEELGLGDRKSVGPYIDEYLSKIYPNKKQNEQKGEKEIKIEEAMIELAERDFKDIEIDELNRKELINKGLALQKPKEVVVIDTGRVKGVENVLDIIKDKITKEIKIIAIEGKSGTGKSTTTKELRKIIDGQIFSMGEIFRYITYCREEADNKNINDVLKNLSYKTVNGELKLFDGELNVSDKLLLQLREKKIETKLPETAVLFQKEVIEFSQKQIVKLREFFSGIVIVEGRSFTLDFLPSDLRVKLIAEPMVRAERRCNQDFFKN